MKICLDYGHGKRTGSRHQTIYEDDLVYTIGEKLLKQLKLNDIDVALTRNRDGFPSLSERCKIANDNKVDLFVSIHINSAENPKANGIEVLHYRGEDNKKFAQKICDAMCMETNAINRGAKERNDLMVLNGTKAKAVLIECGFLSNNNELVKLIDGAYQDKLVKGIIEGLDMEYKEDKPQKETYYRVVCGSCSYRNNAEIRLRELTEKGYKDSFLMTYEK